MFVGLSLKVLIVTFLEGMSYFVFLKIIICLNVFINCFKYITQILSKRPMRRVPRWRIRSRVAMMTFLKKIQHFKQQRAVPNASRKGNYVPVTVCNAIFYVYMDTMSLLLLLFFVIQEIHQL